MSGGVIVLEASPEHVAYAFLGCFIIVFGLVSLFVKEKLFISEAFVSTVFGIIIGPYAIGIFDPTGWEKYDSVTLEFTRIVIAVQVMAAGVSLPRSYVLKEKLSLFMMIVPLMCLMFGTSALLIWGLIPNLSFLESMAIAACVTPTDPVLSNSVVKGRFAEKHVPPRIRYLLSAESGINDGMGLPFLLLGLYLIKEPSAGVAVGKWFYLVWAYQILLSIIIGGVFGFACRKLVKGAKNRNLIDKESFLVFSIALALAVAGIVSIIASDDLLACFVAGNVFAWDDWFSNEIAEAHIQEIIDMLLNLACFVYIGASIPFSSFNDASLGLSVWRLIVLAIVILLFRRLPFVMALKPLIPALNTYRDAAFAGWFGPIGVGAVFFSKLTAMMTSPEHLGEHAHNLESLMRIRAVIFPVVMFLVFSSVLIHGVTVPLLHLQYKYTRTWSRKREDANHAVTRLPHINIGDEIVLRPPTISGSSVGGAPEGDGEQRTIGYDNQRSIGYDNQRSVGFDNQRSIGYDNQRSIGYDHQRSVNQRSYGYGGVLPYAGFGIAGVPDLGRANNINSNNNTVRTLQDVVKEMKEASKGAAANRNLRASVYSPNTNSNNNNGSSSSSNNSGEAAGEKEKERDKDSNSPSINFNLPVKDGLRPPSQGTNTPQSSSNLTNSGSTSSSSSGTPPVIIVGSDESSSDDKSIAQELKQNHPATHSASPSLSQIGSADDEAEFSRFSNNSNGRPLSHHSGDSVIHIHEEEREEDNGVVRIASHEIDERDRIKILDQEMEQVARSLSAASSRRNSLSPSQSSGGGGRGHHLTDLFKKP
ncbi:Sodium/hydrogen exchanger family-domain-containing protein [Linnemannia elongata]|nr:Sodium/hydrogen exchanger family-domain-containing protein [Linnemannia elongata]